MKAPRASLIRPRLYLGDLEDAILATTGASEGVPATHILTVVRGEFFHALFADAAGVTHRLVEVEDDEGENLLAHLPAALDFIAGALRGSPEAIVLVHCMAGVSRSASVMVAHLMRSERLPLAAALDSVRSARPFIDPNIGFRAQLRLFELMDCAVIETHPAYTAFLQQAAAAAAAAATETEAEVAVGSGSGSSARLEAGGAAGPTGIDSIPGLSISDHAEPGPSRGRVVFADYASVAPESNTGPAAPAERGAASEQAPGTDAWAWDVSMAIPGGTSPAVSGLWPGAGGAAPSESGGYLTAGSGLTPDTSGAFGLGGGQPTPGASCASLDSNRSNLPLDEARARQRRIESMAAADVRCRRCRRLLAVEGSLARHEPGAGEAAFGRRKYGPRSKPMGDGAKSDGSPSRPSSAGSQEGGAGASPGVDGQPPPCSSLFLEMSPALPWLQDAVAEGEVEGAIQCPKCAARLGDFAWSGLQCSCGAWVTPGFQLKLSRVDYVPPRRPTD